jgi:hypothetical protein
MQMSEIRVLSVKQPWASLIVRGIKRFEARSWPPKWRGRIAIHASGSPIPRAQWDALCEDSEVHATLKRAGLRDYASVQSLPTSAIVGAVTVSDARVTEDWSIEECSDLDAALSASAMEMILWRLEAPREFGPIENINGKLNLWKITGAHAAKVRQLDGSSKAPAGAPFDDAAVSARRSGIVADMEYAREFMNRKVTVPAALKQVLGTSSKVLVGEAFRALVLEVVPPKARTYPLPWTKEVSASGPIAAALLPRKSKATLSKCCEALAQRLVPDDDPPALLELTITAWALRDD